MITRVPLEHRLRMLAHLEREAVRPTPSTPPRRPRARLWRAGRSVPDGNHFRFGRRMFNASTMNWLVEEGDALRRADGAIVAARGSEERAP